MGGLVVQSIWLSIVVVFFVLLLGPITYITYISALIVGLIPFLYLKKSLKKDILKVNVLSSVVAFVVLIIAYIFLVQLNVYLISKASEQGILFIMNIDGFLSRGFIFLASFNVPFLFYFIFGKKKDVEVRE